MFSKLVGRLDMLVRVESPTPGIYHMQHKTLYGNASIPNYSKAIALSRHEPAYSWLGHQSGIPIQGTLLNIVRKVVSGPMNKKTGKRNVDPYWEPYVRVPIEIGERDRTEFYKDLLWVLDWMDECHEEDEFPRFTHSCVRFNRICPYYDMCKLGEGFFKDQFAKRERDYVDESKGECINISRVNDFASCPRYYYYRYVLGLVGISEPSAALDFGTAVHKFFEVWYGPKNKKKAGKWWAPCFDTEKAIRAFKASLPEDHDSLATECETLAWGEVVLRKYAEEMEALDTEKIVEVGYVEVTLEAKLEVGDGVEITLGAEL